MARWIDRLLAILKWPVAAAALLLLPASLFALKVEASHLMKERAFVPMAIGFGAYAILWWVVLRRPLWGSMLSTFEHELTHAIFALATFHPVTGMRVSWRSGGHTTFEGGTNWLVMIAPYFFPTASISVVLVSRFFDLGETGLGILGASLAYHLISTWRETHARQTDLRGAGFIFSAAFLPAANALSLALLLAWISGGAGGSRACLERVLVFTRAFIE